MINPPLSATIYITNYCQFSCEHCFFQNKKKLNTSYISLTRISEILNNFANNKIIMVIISGGDPTLHPDFIVIINKIKELNMLPLIGLNAILYREKTLQAIQSIGQNYLQISLDCLSNEKPNQFRSLKTHQKAIETLQKKGFRLIIAITVSNKNFNQCIPLAIKLMQLGAYKIKITFWKRTTYGNLKGYQVIAINKNNRLIKQLTLLDPYKKIFVFPDFYFNKLTNHFELNKKPPALIVHADGALSFSELSDSLFNVQICNNIVQKYLKLRKNYASLKRKKLWDNLSNRYSINSIIEVERVKIQASGILLLIDSKKLIFLDRGLSEQEKFFVQIHEVGHLALGLVHKNKHSDPDLEIKVNLWAVKQMKNLVTNSFYQKLLVMARCHDEKTLFISLKNQLDEQTAFSLQGD